MADLIEKYFKGDLTEAEKTALDQELATSDEAAKRFGELAEQAYRRFGLPKPQWTGSDKLRQRGHSDLMTWFWVILMLAGIAGISVFMYVLLKNSASKTLVSAEQSPRTAVDSTSIDSSVETQAQSAPPVHSHPMILAKAPSQNVPSTSTAAPALTPQSPKFTPINVDQNPNRPFSSLSIQLRLTAPRLLMVRILGSQGQELVPLFNGSLPTGNWSFEWNGKLRNGRLAPPGTYKIEVRAGAWSQTKEVIIQK
jgi:hypothetical protein